MPYNFIIGNKSNYSEDPSKKKRTYQESLRNPLTMDPKAIFIASIPVSTGDVPLPSSQAIATISSLTCNSITYSTLPYSTVAFTGTATVPYLGGNGAAYSAGTPISSTTVTGLTVTLRAGTLNNGAGNLIYDISGTPTSTGTAAFAISFAGQTCNLSLTVQATPSSVTIGGLRWTTKNIDITTYSDGTPIPQVTDDTAWYGLTTGAWCYYDNDSANNNTYGKLYNWYAVAGIYDAASLTNPSLRKSFAPSGFRVPTQAEWQSLFDAVSGDVSQLLAISEGGTNTSGFSALNAGYRYSVDGTFNGLGSWAEWWGSTESGNGTEAINPFIDASTYYVNTFFLKQEGSSVRLIFN